MRRLIPLTLVLLVAAACSNESTAVPGTTSATTDVTSTTTTSVAVDPRTPVILDYSPTVSDIGALAFISNHPDLRLVAVTLPGTGESYCERGVAHTRGVLIELGLPDVPVACGPDDPITGWNAFPTSWRVGSNEMDLPEGSPNETRSAPDLLIDLIRDADTPIEIVAVGPLTNLALAFEADPTLIEGIAGITIMGGAVDVPGNVFRNDVGEWNIWVDPTAAGIVFASGASVTLVPLDATNHLPASTIFFDALDAAAASPGSVLVRDLIAVDPFWLGGGFYFWDELAAAVLVDESIVDFETRRLVVDDDLRENKGWTREDPGGSEIRVAVAADRWAFEQLYLDTLVGERTELGYVVPTAAEIAYFAELERITFETSEAFDGIFQSVAGELGIDLDTDGGFFDVVVAALPRILDGPWADRIDAYRSMSVPPLLVEMHEAWLAGFVSFAADPDAIIDALSSEDPAAFENLLLPATEACLAIQEAADIRLRDVAIDCF